jgi:hypothetical protein
VRGRERLIAEIEELAGLDNLREAADRLDALKKQWTITVPDKRSVENRMWKRFQDACNIIQGKRDAERKQHDAQRQANLKRKQALIEELSRAAATADAEILVHAALPARLQDQWREVGEVPRKEEPALDKRWRAAQQQFRKALAAAQSRAQASVFDQLAQRAALCRHWEQAALAGDSVDAEAARTQWKALAPLAGDYSGTMQQRFERAFNRPDDTTLAANLTALRTACLRLEVLLELEFPAEFRTERMAYQVERLNASVKKELDARESMESQLAIVLTTGAVPADAAETIQRRIQNCLAAYGRSLGQASLSN